MPPRTGSHGHEYSGTVVAVGDRGHGLGGRRLGRRRADASAAASASTAGPGRPNLCSGRGAVGEGGDWQGAFADYMRVDERELLRLPDGLSLRDAALTEPLAVALHGITRAGVQAGERVLVTGGGPIGALSRRRAACTAGITDVVVSEPSAVRRALVRAARVPRWSSPRPAAHTARHRATIVDEPFDVALECSGHAVAMEQCLGQLRRTGTLVLVGAGIKPPRFDPNRILLNELVITGAFVYDADGFERALELLASPGFPTDLLVEPDDVGLDELLGRDRAAARGRGPGQGGRGPGTREERRHETRSRAAAAVQPRRDERAVGRCSTRRPRQQLADFYGDVFGLHELPTMTDRRQAGSCSACTPSSSSCSSSPTTRR